MSNTNRLLVTVNGEPLIGDAAVVVVVTDQGERIGVETRFSGDAVLAPYLFKATKQALRSLKRQRRLAFVRMALLELADAENRAARTNGAAGPVH